MKKPEAPVAGKTPFGNVEYGFMRDSSGNIWFLRPHGSATIPYSVLEDGRIFDEGDPGRFFPETVVDIIHPRDLGLTEEGGLTFVSREQLREGALAK